MNEQVVKLLVGQFPMETDGLSIAVSVDNRNVLVDLGTELPCFDDTLTQRDTHTHTLAHNLVPL